ncbi:TonB-dependent receptor domain-containing protein [Sphingobium algorifonticola]|uniref:TonB-dependent receptor n=1 Tax=Sphingobium algorifonticola TaxID=2008318 RepID=A0A437JCQ1_9SPHN|nr:TonB-dependent receptor [Sphingobium algorifonticola]RVT43671.1 TonB-dependent receptor [Sphingobium algorifonticola]
MPARHMIAVVALVFCGGIASAQDVIVDQSVRFTLKPALRRSPLAPVRPAAPLPGLDRLSRPVPGDEPDHVLAVRVQRQSRRYVGMRADIQRDDDAPGFDYRPRSRSRLISVMDRFVLSDQVAMTVGFRGVKVSNRNANVTIGSGDDRLNARDWFLPHAAISLRPTSAIALSADYSEAMRAYGDTGFTGPLGLSRPDFEALRMALRPEKSRFASLGGQYEAAGLTLATRIYRADIRNGLSFAARAYMPTNIGSASLLGTDMQVRHQITQGLDWSASYRQANVATTNGRSMQEREMAMAAHWARGPWRITAQASRTGRAALAALGTQQSPFRGEGGIEYTSVQARGRTLRLAAHIRNPSRLVSIGLLDSTTSAGLRAVDQARAVMFSADMAW